MSNIESDELLREVSGKLDKIIELLKPAQAEPETNRIVTGEEAPRPAAKKTVKVTGR